MRIWMYHIGLAVQVFVLSYAYVQGKNGMRDVYAMQKDTEKAQEQVAVLAQEIDRLKSDIATWDANPFYKEKIAREHLHMARRGDMVYYR